MQAAPDSDGDVVLERSGAVACIRLNRPQALNAVTPGMVQAIDAALDDCAAHPAVRVVVLTGTGRAFCVGADLKRAAERAATGPDGPTATDAFMAAFNALANRIEAFPRPVLAAINGMTMGAGLELALAADVILASSAARIGDGHARYGLLPGGGASARLPRRVGEAAAKWMFFTGEFQSNEDLLRWGLLQAVFAEEHFEVEVRRVCDLIAARSPLGLARLKELANAARCRSLPEALAAEQAMLRLHMTSGDRAEGLAAFAGKRKPVFTGD